jgi:hypothetical protein
MMTQPLAPYLQLSENSVVWTIDFGGHELTPDAPTIIEDWHPAQEVSMSVTVEMILGAQLKALELQAATAKLGFFVTAHSVSTGFKWVSKPWLVTGDYSQMDAVLPAHKFGGTLRLEASIFVSDVGLNPGKLSPPKYAVLNRLPVIAVLEGELARPSIVICEFNSPRNKDALWEFDTNFPKELQDWFTADLSTVVSIKLNNKYFENLGEESAFEKLLAADFLAVLIDGVLALPEIGKFLIEENPKQATGTLWVTTKSALSSVFASDDANFVYQEYSNRRQKVRSIIQSVSNAVLGAK